MRIMMAINLHPEDSRAQEVINKNLMALDQLQESLEKQITDYALENPENLYDTKSRVILRKLEFSKGLKWSWVILSPAGLICATSRHCPGPLILQIHNALI